MNSVKRHGESSSEREALVGGLDISQECSQRTKWSHHLDSQLFTRLWRSGLVGVSLKLSFFQQNQPASMCAEHNMNGLSGIVQTHHRDPTPVSFRLDPSYAFSG